MTKHRNVFLSIFLAILSIILIIVSTFSVLALFSESNNMTRPVLGVCFCAYEGNGMPVSKGSAILVMEGMPKLNSPAAYMAGNSSDVLYVQSISENEYTLCNSEGVSIVTVSSDLILGEAILFIPYLGHLISLMNLSYSYIICAVIVIITIVVLCCFLFGFKKKINQIEIDESIPEKISPEAEIFGRKEPLPEVLADRNQKEVIPLWESTEASVQNLRLIETKKDDIPSKRIIIDTDKTAGEIKLSVSAVIEQESGTYSFAIIGSRKDMFFNSVEEYIRRNGMKAETTKSKAEYRVETTEKKTALVISALVLRIAAV